MLTSVDIEYNSFVGISHPCVRCKGPLDTRDLHVKVCGNCKRLKRIEITRNWRQKQKAKEVIA